MIHKQISLPEKLDRQIKHRAKLLQEPEERVIRDLLYLGSSNQAVPGETAVVPSVLLKSWEYKGLRI
jgi:hypothetical protein